MNTRLADGEFSSKSISLFLTVSEPSGAPRKEDGLRSVFDCGGWVFRWLKGLGKKGGTGGRMMQLDSQRGR